MPNSALLSLDDAARLLYVTRPILDRWVADGVYRTVEQGGHTYLRQADVDAYLAPALRVHRQVRRAYATGVWPPAELESLVRRAVADAYRQGEGTHAHTGT